MHISNFMLIKKIKLYNLSFEFSSMPDTRIVIFGARGHIGYELYKIFSKSNTVLAPTRLI